jgi:hypothetical protein
MNYKVTAAVGAGMALCMLAGCATARPMIVYKEGNVSITRMDFHGWPHCYRLSNGTAEVTVVPQVARIMQYGPAGEEGLLFVNPALTPEAIGTAEPKEYPDYGGHKLWVAPERVWGWPPDPALDRGPCSVTVLADGALLVTGTPSPTAGVRFDRLLRLDPEGTRLTIEQRMTNTSGAPVTWGIWDVTQVTTDDTAVIPLGEGAQTRFGEGEEAAAQWRRVGDAYLVTKPESAQKLFVSGGPGWLACRTGGWLFLKSFKIQEAAPPEPETPREAWVGTRGFMELEFVGPEVTLKPGQTTALTQEWRYYPLGPEAATDEGLVRAAGQAAASAGVEK